MKCRVKGKTTAFIQVWDGGFSVWDKGEGTGKSGAEEWMISVRVKDDRMKKNHNINTQESTATQSSFIVCTYWVQEGGQFIEMNSG